MKGREPVHACARLCKVPEWTDVHASASLVHPTESSRSRHNLGVWMLVPGPVRVCLCIRYVRGCFDLGPSMSVVSCHHVSSLPACSGGGCFFENVLGWCSTPPSPLLNRR